MPRTDAAKSQELSTRLAHADQLMKNQSFPEAIVLYEAHLATAPKDLAALLKLGLCHLLNRSENHFLRIFHAAGKMVDVAPDLSGEVHALWHKYQGLVVKVTAGALVVGGLSMAGCTSQGNALGSASNPAATVTKPGQNLPGLTPPSQSQDNFPITAHKYSGGIYLPMHQEDELRFILEKKLDSLEEKQGDGDTQK